MMNLYWIWLTQISGIGPVNQNKILQHFQSPQHAYEAAQNGDPFAGILTKRQQENLLTSLSLEKGKRILENCEKTGTNLLTIQDPRYPTRAKALKDTPILLYYRGQIKEIPKSAGVVGARRCTQSNKEKTIQLVEQLVAENYAIISGMAKGIDSYAHTVCLENGGYTIAVLGNGVDICYPKEHDKLKKKIEETGLILSEYPPYTKPTTYAFPKRNRLISAWSDKLYLIVPPDMKKSGALITAKATQTLDRPLTIL